MFKMFTKFVLLSTVLSLSYGLEWIDEDAIYIEDGAIINHPSDLTRGDPTIEPPPITSIPVEIVPGHCLKASECYPILFYSSQLSPQGQTRVVDKNLYKYILNHANYCEVSDIPPQALDNGKSLHQSDDIYIWCPIRTFPTTKPEVVIALSNSTEEELITTTTLPNILDEPIQCGPLKTNLDDQDDDHDVKYRVVGGKDAGLGEFPWMVALTNKGKQFCSGSLIDSRHVLLAAHCLSHLRQKDLKYITAYIGDHNIKDPTDVSHQERNVSAVIFHANFSMQSVHSDIGMMFLSEPVTFGDNVSPICLSQGITPFDDGSVYGILTGWGQPAENKPSSNTLMKTNLRIWRWDECREKYQGKIPGNISSKMFCAGSIAPTLKDACKGDSGGPLQLVRDSKVEQVGIVSFGIGCGLYPGVFTKVPDYLEWIEKHRIRSSKYFGNN